MANNEEQFTSPNPSFPRISKRYSSPQHNVTELAMENVDKRVLTTHEHPHKIERHVLAGKRNVAVSIAVIGEDAKHVTTGSTSRNMILTQSKIKWLSSPQRSTDSMTPNLYSLQSSLRSSIDDDVRTTDNDADVESNMSEHVNEDKMFSLKESSAESSTKKHMKDGGDEKPLLTCCFVFVCLLVITILFTFDVIPDGKTISTSNHGNLQVNQKRRVSYERYLGDAKVCSNIIVSESHLFVPIHATGHDQCKLLHFNLLTGEKYVNNQLFQKPLKMLCTSHTKCIFIYKDGKIVQLGDYGYDQRQRYCFHVKAAILIADINNDRVEDILFSCVSKFDAHSFVFISGLNLTHLKTLHFPLRIKMEAITHPRKHDNGVLFLAKKYGNSFLFHMNSNLRLLDWKNSVHLISTDDQPISNISFVDVNNDNKGDIFFLKNGSIVKIVDGLNMSTIYRLKINSTKLIRYPGGQKLVQSSYAVKTLDCSSIFTADFEQFFVHLTCSAKYDHGSYRTFPLLANGSLFIGLIYYQSKHECPYKVIIYDIKKSMVSSIIFIQQLPHVISYSKDLSQLLIWQEKQQVRCTNNGENEITKSSNESRNSARNQEINRHIPKNSKLADDQYDIRDISIKSELADNQQVNQHVHATIRLVREKSSDKKLNHRVISSDKKLNQRRLKKREYNPMYKEYQHNKEVVRRAFTTHDDMSKKDVQVEKNKQQEDERKYVDKIESYINEIQQQLLNGFKAAIILFTGTMNGPNIDQSVEYMNKPNLDQSDSKKRDLQHLQYQQNRKAQEYNNKQENDNRRNIRHLESSTGNGNEYSIRPIRTSFVFERPMRYRTKRSVAVDSSQCSVLQLRKIVFDGKKTCIKEDESTNFQHCNETLYERVVKTFIADTSWFITYFELYSSDDHTFVASRIVWNDIN